MGHNRRMREGAIDQCVSCLGAGELGTENGPVTCPDCFGEGFQVASLERIEWRMRDIERVHKGEGHGCEADIHWLIQQLRRNREALIQILSRCQDEPTTTRNLTAHVQFVANQALGLYETKPDPSVQSGD
jgi:hypothetical protein